MKDFLKKYRKHKLINNVNIILVSLVLAVGVNFVFFDNSNLSNNLKASIINTKNIENKANIFIEKFENNIYIVSNKEINNLENLSLSLTFNPENVTIWDINSEYGDIISLNNTAWISSLILSSKTWTNIKKGDKLIKLSINKKYEKTENINIMNANFKDINNEHFLLTTSWITF